MLDFDALSHPTYASLILVVSVLAGSVALICAVAHVPLSVALVPWWAASAAGAIAGGSVGLCLELRESGRSESTLSE